MPLTAQGAATLFLIWGLYLLLKSVFFYPYKIKTVKIKIKNRSGFFVPDGFTILHISDLHTREYGKKQRLIAEALRRMPEADLAVITGDIAEEDRFIDNNREIFGAIRSKGGIFCVRGNNDIRLGEARLKKFLLGCGARLLINENRAVSASGAKIIITGVDDPHKKKDDLKKAAPAVKDAFSLLLAHSPDILLDPGFKMFDLILSGHTHNGQIRLPLLGVIFAHSRIGRKYVCGLHAVDGVPVYISGGLGESVLKMRLNNYPELALVTIDNQPPAAGIKTP